MEYKIYTEDGVYWGISAGNTFKEACQAFFGTDNSAPYQIIGFEIDWVLMTFNGVKLVERG